MTRTTTRIICKAGINSGVLLGSLGQRGRRVVEGLEDLTTSHLTHLKPTAAWLLRARRGEGEPSLKAAAAG